MTTLVRALKNRTEIVNALEALYEANASQQQINDLCIKQSEIETQIKKEISIVFKVRKSTYTTEATITIDAESAKLLAKTLKNVSKGSWDYLNIVKPIRSQVRTKERVITLYTEGYGISDIAQKLSSLFGNDCYKTVAI